MIKIKLIHFFKTDIAEEMADFIAVAIETDHTYYIHKCRLYNHYQGTTINNSQFLSLLCTATRPIILSDSYINLEHK